MSKKPDLIHGLSQFVASIGLIFILCVFLAGAAKVLFDVLLWIWRL